MTPTQFTKWLAEMKNAGLAKTDKACAAFLGVSANGILLMKKNGTDKRTALACQALLYRLTPYGYSPD